MPNWGLLRKKYKEAFAIWREVFDEYPILTTDDVAEDLLESIRRYMIAVRFRGIVG